VLNCPELLFTTKDRGGVRGTYDGAGRLPGGTKFGDFVPPKGAGSIKAIQFLYLAEVLLFGYTCHTLVLLDSYAAKTAADLFTLVIQRISAGLTLR